MLKHLKFSGVLNEEILSVCVTLENPADYGLDVTALVLSVVIKEKNGISFTPNMDAFTFYIIDESNRMYNAEFVSTPDLLMPTDDADPLPKPDGLIVTDFKHEFLYQDLRIAFYHQPHQRLHIIDLRH